MGAAAGGVFVARDSLRSRRDAVLTIADSFRREQYPPIMIFPEGRMGTGEYLFPYQPNVFKMAIRFGIPYLVCAVRYDRPDIAVWHGRLGETMLTAYWRVACFPGQLHADVTPLLTRRPEPDQSSKALAREAQTAVEEEMGFDLSTP
jgi:1-acyl-sn-glycerol-3-phosphate acyltransferase